MPTVSRSGTPRQRNCTGQRGLYAFWRNSSRVVDANAFRALGRFHAQRGRSGAPWGGAGSFLVARERARSMSVIVDR